MEPRSPELDALSQRLRAVEERWRPGEGHGEPKPVETASGVLRRHRLHEWLGVEEALREGQSRSWRDETDGAERKKAAARRKQGGWTPALAVLIDAAGSAWREAHGLVMWIGKAVWPYAVSLPAEVSAESLLVDPPVSERLWAIDLSLRSRAVTAVVADGSGLSLRATRRLQLAAEAGRSLALLARPGHERWQRSAAAYRWLVRALRNELRQARAGPRWEVELIRCKDATLVQDAGTALKDLTGMPVATLAAAPVKRVVEWRHGEGLVIASAVVGDAAAESPRLAGSRRRRA